MPTAILKLLIPRGSKYFRQGWNWDYFTINKLINQPLCNLWTPCPFKVPKTPSFPQVENIWQFNECIIKVMTYIFDWNTSNNLQQCFHIFMTIAVLKGGLHVAKANLGTKPNYVFSFDAISMPSWFLGHSNEFKIDRNAFKCAPYSSNESSMGGILVFLTSVLCLTFYSSVLLAWY